MGRVWFTADLHLGHENILRFCKRPFDSIGQHDEALIANWNSVVGPSDTIFVVGDFAHKMDPSRVRRIFERLSGEKHLVIGNHDPRHTQELPWASVSERLAVSVDGARLLLDHYPGRSWAGSNRGVTQLFGHTHGRLEDLWNACDVGVDRWGYTPVSWPQIRARLAAIPRPEALVESVEDEPSGPKI